jgi:hypothetical protein
MPKVTECHLADCSEFRKLPISRHCESPPVEKPSRIAVPEMERQICESLAVAFHQITMNQSASKPRTTAIGHGDDCRQTKFDEGWLIHCCPVFESQEKPLSFAVHRPPGHSCPVYFRIHIYQQQWISVADFVTARPDRTT